MTLETYPYILSAMLSRRAVSLLVLVCITLASFCLVPAGQGPYSVVYGPKTPMRAYRASLQLMQAVVAIVIVSTTPEMRISQEFPSSFEGDEPPGECISAIHSVLRC